MSPVSACEKQDEQGRTLRYRRYEQNVSEVNEAIFDCTGGKSKQTSFKNPELPNKTEFPKGVTGSR